METYGPGDSQWKEAADLRTPRRAAAAVSLPTGIYIIGGYDGTNYLASVERLDPVRGRWVEMSPMNTPRCTLAAAASADGQYIYAIGGFDGAALNIVERYSVQADVWTELPEMSDPRFMHACVLSKLAS